MAQFNISKNLNKASKADVSYIMDIQSNSVLILGTRIVIHYDMQKIILIN